jgi:hypothetical protein
MLRVSVIFVLTVAFVTLVMAVIFPLVSLPEMFCAFTEFTLGRTNSETAADVIIINNASLCANISLLFCCYY